LNEICKISRQNSKPFLGKLQKSKWAAFSCTLFCCVVVQMLKWHHNRAKERLELLEGEIQQLSVMKFIAAVFKLLTE